MPDRVVFILFWTNTEFLRTLIPTAKSSSVPHTSVLRVAGPKDE